MKIRIISIGRSQGIRIPKSLLKQAGLQGVVDIYAQGNSLIIGRARKPREGWEEALREMVRQGEDLLIDDAPPSLTPWDDEGWVWE